MINLANEWSYNLHSIIPKILCEFDMKLLSDIDNSKKYNFDNLIIIIVSNIYLYMIYINVPLL